MIRVAEPADGVLQIEYDGKTYTLDTTQLSGIDDAKMFAALGIPTGAMFRLWGDPENFGMHLVAAFVWLARLHAGERHLTYDQVAAQVNSEAANAIRIIADESADEPVGEAPAAD